MRCYYYYYLSFTSILLLFNTVSSNEIVCSTSSQTNPLITLINGNFETGNLTGWELVDLIDPPIAADVYATDTTGFDLIPTDGKYAFYSSLDSSHDDEDISTIATLTTESFINICNGYYESINSTLLFDYGIGSWFGVGDSPEEDRIFSINILSMNNSILETIEIARLDHDNIDFQVISDNNYEISLLSYINLNIKIQFIWLVPEPLRGPGGAMLDNIRINACCRNTIITPQPTKEPTEEPTEDPLTL